MNGLRAKKSWQGLLAVIGLFIGVTPQHVSAELNENCVISILNRTIQVDPNGGWSMPNVPSNMGQIRARATCEENGQTISGQSNYFTVVRNDVTRVGEIVFENLEPIPESLVYVPSDSEQLNSQGATLQLLVFTNYPDGSTADVTSANSGVNYTSTNPAIASVTVDGLVTANASGSVLITARKDGAVAVKRITVNTVGDTDGDGLPDDYELANGLNPTDAIDAQEDQDRDGLTALEEFNLGSDPNDSDSDGDGIDDGEETVAGEDGFITDPLNSDTDGDGLSDSLEIIVGSSPVNGNDTNLAGALDSVEVTPTDPVITFNTIFTEASIQLTVSGNLIDGTQIDLTSTATGTTYSSSDLSVASFGIAPGQVFAGVTGLSVISINNNGFQAQARITVNTFTPTALSATSIPGYANNVEVVGGYAFIAAGASGLQVVDVSNPNSPAVVAGLDTPGTSIDIRIVGNLAYIADGASGLQIMDISNPLNPQLVGTIDTTGIAQDLKVQGDFTYIADGDSGLQLVDISDPSQPQLAGSLNGLGTALGVDVQGSQVVMVAGSSLYVIDVQDPTQPNSLGSVNVGTVKDVVIGGNYAHVPAYSTGYRVVDISNPAAPIVVGGDRSIAARDVELTSGLAFYAEQLFPNVIAYINIQDPTNPVFQGTIDFSSLGDYAGTGIALDDQYIYVTEERFVVSQDYKSTGDTRLFIAQYRFLNDTGNIPPTVNITSPVNGSDILEGQTIPIQVDATDDVFVAAVNFVVDDEVVFTDTAAPYEYNLIAEIGVGSYTIGAFAVDLAGNRGDANDLTVNVLPDTNPPNITVLSPLDGDQFIEGETIRIQVDATDDISVSSVEFIINSSVVFTDTVSPFEYEFTAEVGVNTYLISVDAQDPSGNIGSTGDITIDVIPDPLTTAIGTVVDIDGNSVAGATVDCLGVTGLTDAVGTFSVIGLPTLISQFSCSASHQDGAGLTLSGRSASAAPVRGGITDVGQIRVLRFNDHIFVADYAGHRILEVEPINWTVSVFADSNDGVFYPNSLTFSPSGQLLVGTYVGGASVLQFDSQGNGSVLLDSNNGVTGVFGANNLLFNSAGDLYAYDWVSGRILVFGQSQGNANAFADLFYIDGMIFDSSEQLWTVSRIYSAQVFNSSASIIATDSLPCAGTSITHASKTSDIYVSCTTGAVYKYTNEDINQRSLLGNYGGGAYSAIQLSLDESVLYYTNYNQGNLIAIDPITGESTELLPAQSLGLPVSIGIQR